MLLHLRVVPGFWAAIEERDRPELRAHPLILGGLPSQRGAVREANVLAGHCGVRPGMSLTQAHQHCPDGVFLSPNIPRYEAAWEEVCEIVRGFTPLVEPLEMGQAICDLTGCERLWGDIWTMARKIAIRVREQVGIELWLGVASNRLTAQLASMTVGVDGITIVEEGQERHFLAALPITHLPDVDPRLALIFQVLGLRTIGQFAALSASAVTSRFGAAGQRLHRAARGNDSCSVVPPPQRPAISARHDCDEGSYEEALECLHGLAETCATELQERGLAGRLIALKLFWEKPIPHSSTPLPIAPTSDASMNPAPALPVGLERREGGSRTQAALQQGTRATPTATSSALEPAMPVPYRIHSMLPQPGLGLPHRGPALPVFQDENLPTPSKRHSDKEMIALREPISTAPALFEKAQRLLYQSWRQGMSKEHSRGLAPVSRLLAIELEISQFAEPLQLAFDGLNLLGQTGGLGGSITGRQRVIAEQDRVLTARHGTEPFRHVARVNPSSILTERRFQWRSGLSWKGTLPKRPASPRRGSSSRRQR